MAGREMKDRERLAYTFTLHKTKDAALIEYLEDKSITSIVKEALNNQSSGNLNIPPGKVLIDNEELMRLVSLATGNVVPNKSAVPNGDQSEAVKVKDTQTENPEKPELTEDQKKLLAKANKNIGLGIATKKNKN